MEGWNLVSSRAFSSEKEQCYVYVYVYMGESLDTGVEEHRSADGVECYGARLLKIAAGGVLARHLQLRGHDTIIGER
jgi:hypothetical protein